MLEIRSGGRKWKNRPFDSAVEMQLWKEEVSVTDFGDLEQTVCLKYITE